MGALLRCPLFRGRLTPEIPVEISAALIRCLAKAPDQRWPNAEAFRAALAGSADDEVPIQLEGVSNIFLEILLCAAGLWYIAAWWMGGGGVEDILTLVPLFLGATGIGMASLLVSRIRRLRRSGFAEARIQFAAFGQPRWWLGWYPRRLRAPGDVWDQLPTALRRARALLAATVVVLFLVLIPNMLTVLGHDRYYSTHRSPRLVMGQMVQMGTEPYPRWVRDAVSNSVISLFLSLAAAALLQVWRWERLARRRVADSELRGYMLVTWTGKRSFWRQPEIASFLLPPGASSRIGFLAEPTTASGLADAVSAIVSSLPAPARAQGANARAAAQRLVEAIASLDRQIAGLARAFDPTEAKRLAAKLAALGPDRGPADENLEIREILRKQLEPITGLEVRIEDAKARRARLLELLKELRLQLGELQAGSGDSAKSASATGRVQKLLAQINELEMGAKTIGTDRTRATEAISDAPTIERT